MSDPKQPVAPETGEPEWRWAMRSAWTRLLDAADRADHPGLATLYRDTGERLRRAIDLVDGMAPPAGTVRVEGVVEVFNTPSGKRAFVLVEVPDGKHGQRAEALVRPLTPDGETLPVPVRGTGEGG